MDVLMECCCGLDVHKDMVEACIIKGSLEVPLIHRSRFLTDRTSLIALTQWLSDHACYHIAMESTGIYWRTVYETIEEYAPRWDALFVVNAQHMRNLPGRKSDVKDAEWIATLLRHGLLQNSFIPPKDERMIREYSRLHRALLGEKVRCANQLEKFLQLHGFKLSGVMNDIHSVIGRRLLNHLARHGKLEEEDVAQCAGNRLKRPLGEICAAVCGRLHPAEQRMLQLLLLRLDEVAGHIAEVDEQLFQLTAPYQEQMEILVSIPGISTLSAAMILGEIGTCPRDYFPTSAQLTSWAGLVPRNDQSAGKVKSRKILPGNPYIKSILCQVSWVAVRTRKSHYHEWFWSRQGKLGRKKAIVAVSRKMLKLIYYLLATNQCYDLELARAV